MTAPGDRLAKIAQLLRACPPPGMASGYDQCAHGTWPCATTEATWLASGSDRDQEVQAACEAAAQKAQLQDIAWEQHQELLAAQREGRLPYWEAEAEPEAG